MRDASPSTAPPTTPARSSTTAVRPARGPTCPVAGARTRRPHAHRPSAALIHRHGARRADVVATVPTPPAAYRSRALPPDLTASLPADTAGDGRPSRRRQGPDRHSPPRSLSAGCSPDTSPAPTTHPAAASPPSAASASTPRSGRRRPDDPTRRPRIGRRDLGGRVRRQRRRRRLVAGHLHNQDHPARPRRPNLDCGDARRPHRRSAS